MRSADGKLRVVASRAPEEVLKIEQRDATTKETIILSIMEDPREINDEADDEGMAEDNVKCPEIDIEIEGLYVRGLVDTGSPITCLSEEFFLANNKSFQACPKLPVIGHMRRFVSTAPARRASVETCCF